MCADRRRLAARASLGAVCTVALLTLAALGVRAVGLDFGVPLLREGDSHIPQHVELLRRGQVLQPKKNQDNVQYPRLLAGAVSLLPRAELERPAEASLEQHLAVARHTDVQVRALVALLAALAIPGTWLLARRTLGDRWALLAAAIPATSLLHLCFSQQARPHAAFASLFLFTVLAALRLRARPTWTQHAIVGVLAGLTLGCLQSGLIALPPIAVAWWLRERDASAAGGRRRWLDPRPLLTVLLVGVSIRVFYAFLFESQLMEERGVFHSEGTGFQLANHRLDLSMFDGSGLASVGRALWNWDPEWLPLLVLATVGLLVAPRRAADPTAARSQRRDRLVVLSAVLPYLLVICVYARTYERFLLPLVPFAAVYMAAGLRGLFARLGGVAARGALVAAIAAALVSGGIAATRFAWVRSRPDTLELASAWVREHVDPASETVFVTPPMDLAVGRSDESLKRPDGKRLTTLFSPWSRHQFYLTEAERPAPLYDLRWLVVDRDTGDLDDPATLQRYVDAHGPGVYVVEVAAGRGSRFLGLLAAELGRRGAREARFSPDPDPYFSNHPLLDEDEEVPDWPHVFTRVLRARAVGPVIEVYRVR